MTKQEQQAAKDAERDIWRERQACEPDPAVRQVLRELESEALREAARKAVEALVGFGEEIDLQEQMEQIFGVQDETEAKE